MARRNRHGVFQVAELVKEKQRVVAGATEVSVVGRAFSLALGLADREKIKGTDLDMGCHRIISGKRTESDGIYWERCDNGVVWIYRECVREGV